MYVITFYSYKGGVGRSMALVNVGMHFAKQGKRVLFVDFDLEAPGLGSYEGTGRINSARGIVDYVTEYMEKGAAPDVNNFLTPGRPVSGQGETWFMGAGKQDDGYAARLGAIDWLELYQSNDGFLLFEDLRQQWERALNPDYVLIDSRTGVTDIGGICTRQLPDAVCFVAYPTDQNLVGLERIVRTVKQEASELPDRARDLHLVISNVPKLDDENDILATAVQRFREGLALPESPVMIHYYNSLSLLKQSVFVVDRPNTELARAYVVLADRLADRNVSDRDAALARLRRWFTAVPGEPGSEPAGDVLRAIEEIRKAHDSDGEVLFWLARAYRRWGDVEQALALLEAALASNYAEPAVLSDRILLLFLAGKADIAKKSLQEIFASNTPLGLLDIERLLHLGHNLNVPLRLSESDLVRNLSPEDRVSIAESALRIGMSKEADHLAKKLLIEGKLNSTEEQRARNVRGQLAIKRGRLQEAIAIMNSDGRAPSEHRSDTAFHIAVAMFWLGRPEAKEWMERGILDSSEATSSDPSSMQCWAFALFVCGQRDSAIEHLRRARQLINRFPYVSFSVWRYEAVNDDEFIEDYEALNSLFHGEAVRPTYATHNNGGSR
jgi:MinD-like ATPase involved in chromosome partitioning or flagellar assembly